ncbi:MAG: gliding motility-associated C-terminal domain-containing protein, partial [Chitinophagaceae bacterium]|nr:gliding motility-associated C-terminal domain-containing protein [Chitinophagaceae bacterium]
EIKTITGCITTDRQIVKIIPFVEIYVPTAFTPNNDGLNDFLRPALLGIKELRYFRVFNRWGQLVFETKSELPGWDGNLKGLLQGTQALVWMAEGTGVDNKVYRRKGTTTLIR